MKRLIYILIAAAILTSCTKEIDPKIKNFSPQLVVNSLVSADSTVKLHLSRSQLITSSIEIDHEENATVFLYRNGSLIGTMNHTGQGVYEFGLTPSTGDTLSIEVETVDLSCSAQDVLPEPLQVNSIDTATTIFIEGKDFFQIDLELNDTPIKKNFYSIQAFLKYREYELVGQLKVDSIEAFQKIEFLTDDMRILTNRDNQIIREELLFPDSLFQGTSPKLRFGTYDLRDLPSNVIPLEMELIVRSLSRNSYLYFTTLNAHLYYQDDPFSLPVEVVSNVENGLGIFGGMSEKVMVIDLTK